MSEHSSEKKKSGTQDALQPSISHTNKKVWQTPHLLEMDYSGTSAATGAIDDGGGFS